MSAPLVPLFVRLEGRRVLVVGGGAVALQKARALAEAGAELHVVAPEVLPELAALARGVVRRAFEPGDVYGAWLVVAAVPADVSAEVKTACDAAHVFLVAVDDPPACSAYSAASFRRGDLVVAIGTDGRAPALAGLLRRALEALLPVDVEAWVGVAERDKQEGRARGLSQADRRRSLAAVIGRFALEGER